MKIDKTLDFLYNLRFTGIKLGLENINNLLNEYQIEHQKLNIIHVAGTNGKGSTSNILSSVYREAGYKVGIFTSPHLICFNERIKINGKMISDEEIADLADYFSAGIKRNSCTFFEATTAMALKYFSDNKVDIVIFEVGLGGRLDSTNVVTPLLSVIVGINLDHTSYLGNSLIEIAREKAGIIKKGVPVVANDRKKFILKKIASIAKKKQARFFPARLKLSVKTHKSSGKNIVSFNFGQEKVTALYNLRGSYQLLNLKTAVTALKVLKKKFPLTGVQIENGLKRVIVKGRMEEISLEPHIMIDAAHNPHGLMKLKEEISKLKFNKLHLVTGTVKDKDYRQYIRTVVDFNAVKYFVQPSMERGLEVDKIENYLQSYGRGLSAQKKRYSFYSTVKAGFEKACENYEDGDLIFVTGSHFVLADLLTDFKTL